MVRSRGISLTNLLIDQWGVDTDSQTNQMCNIPMSNLAQIRISIELCAP